MSARALTELAWAAAVVVRESLDRLSLQLQLRCTKSVWVLNRTGVPPQDEMRKGHICRCLILDPYLPS